MMFPQILKNSIDLLSSRLVNVFAQLGIVVLISRRLGPDVFGEFAFMNAVVMTGTAVAIFGLDTFMVREVSRGDKQGNLLLWTILRFKIVISAMVIGSIFILFRYVLDTRSLSNLLTLYSVAICLNALAQSFWFYGDAFNRFRLHAFLWAGSNLVRLGFIWLLFLYETNLLMVIIAIILAESTSLIVSYATVMAIFQIKPVNVDVQDLMALLKKCYPMALIIILSVLYFRIDLIMLKIVATATAAGYFAASLRIVEFIAIVPSTIFIAAFPVLSKNYVNDRQAFSESTRQNLPLIATAAFCIAIFIYVLSPQIIHSLYGAAFSESTNCLRIMSGVIFLFFLTGYFTYFHMAMGNEKRVASILIAATLLKILSNYILIPRFGPAGSAMATLFAEIMMMILYGVPYLFLKESKPLDNKL